MRRLAWVLGVMVGLAGLADAQTLPELFQAAKEQVKAGSWTEAMRTLDALETESSKTGHEQARQQLEAPLTFYRGVCEANLGRADAAVETFQRFLELQPNASIDSAMYSKKAVAAFERAQKAAASRAPSLIEAYGEFRIPPDASDRDPADEHWADGPVRWILTSTEKTAWSGISDPNERVAFVDSFWASRDGVPGAGDRSYRQEFERRVAFADANLAQDEERRGSLTDRGMVFVLLGPPTYAGRKPLRTGDDQSDAAGMFDVGSQDAKNAEKALRARPGMTSGKLAAQSVKFGGPGKNAVDTSQGGIEVWHYRRERLPRSVPYQQVDVSFLTKKGYGILVLQRAPESENAISAARVGAAPAPAP